MPGRTTKAEEPSRDVSMEDEAPPSHQPEVNEDAEDEAMEENDEQPIDDDWVDDKQRVRIVWRLHLPFPLLT